MTTPYIPTPQDAYAGFEPPPPPAVEEINPDNPPWGVAAGVGLWLMSLMLMVVMPALFFFPYAQQRGVPAAEMVEFATNDKTAVFLQVLSIIPTHLITLGLAWALVTHLGRRPFFRSLGWTWDARFDFARSAALAFGLYLVGIAAIYLIGGPETQLDKIINSSRATAFVAALMATATAPLVEEVVYRGLLYSSLKKATSASWAVAVVFALFALVHVPQYWPHFGVLLTICLLSLVLTLVRARTKSLLPCFVIHLIFNGVQAVLIVLAPYLPKMPESTPQGAHLAHLLTTLAALFV